MAALILFVYGLIVLMLTVNALRRPSPPTNRLPAIWLFAMITSELAPSAVAVRIAIAAAGMGLGALDDRRGRIGIGMIALSLVLMIPVFIRRRAAARQAGPSGPLPANSFNERFSWRNGLPEAVEIVCEVEYHPGLTLDLYRAIGPRPIAAPTLVYVHGGSWTGGDPHRQSRPLFHHLAAMGWQVATIRYPLSPEATFPEHVVAINRALVFLKGTEGAGLGVDADRLVLSGGSAGAHLASLVALGADEPLFRPGFGSADTSVAACVVLYGIYDFLNRHNTRIDWPIIPAKVMKATAAAAPDLYRLASPIDHVHSEAPPFLVVHGTHDSLVPPREAEVFVDALRRVSRNPVEYLPVIGAQHGFDAISSIRTRAVARRISDFLHTVVPVSNRVG